MIDTASKIGIDRLAPEEIRALDAYTQYGLLSELLKEIKRLTDLKCQAIELHTEAKILAIEDASPANKAAVLRAKKTIDKLAAHLGGRRQQAIIMQSLIKAMNV